MGSSIQKNKSSDLKKGSQLVGVKETDLKESPNLGEYRWFYNTQYVNWEIYNSLSKEVKNKTVFWNIFPLETSNEIERAYINRFPYEKFDKMIFFDFLQKKHVLVCNKEGSMSHLGIVKKDLPQNIKTIKKLNHFDTNYYLLYLDNTLNPYQYNLLNNLALIYYENIFSFFNFEGSDDKLIKKFLSTTFLCSKKFFTFLNTDYQDYLKTNFLKFKATPFSLVTLQSMLLFDFQKEQIYINYFLNSMNENNFDVVIMNMFLEAGSFYKQILEFSAKCSKKNLEYTTFYLCLMFILKTQKEQKGKSINNNINNETRGNNNQIRDVNENNNIENEEQKGNISTYYYLQNENKRKYYANNYYLTNNCLITSKNKFNNLFEKDIESKNKYIEIEIRIPKTNYKTNLHPLFNLHEFYLKKYSLYNEDNILFQSNCVFKCLNTTPNKIIFELVLDATSNPFLYLLKDSKKRFGIYEEGFRFLTEEQKNQVLIARVRSKEAKSINELKNLRELEIFDDSEPKTDILTVSSFFISYKKLNCLSIVGNNMGNQDCFALSNGLKYLKELKNLNLAFNSLTDSNISKLYFTNNTKIEYLNLKSNSATELCMEHFRDELIKLKNLKELILLDNQFGDQGFKYLLQVFVDVKNIKILNLSNCNINNVGINYFSEFLKNSNNYMKKLEVLNFISNPFGDDCLNNLIYIIKNLPSLKKFSLAQTQITPNATYCIHQMLLKEKNPNWIFDDNGGWFTLIEKNIAEEKKFNIIIKENETPVKFHNINIKWLKSHKNKLQNKTCFDFTEANLKLRSILDLVKELPNFPNLKILNFNFNDGINVQGYEALTNCFKKLTNITTLNFCNSNINDKSLECVCSCFDKCSNLAFINLSINNITSIGFSNFCVQVGKNKIILKEIDFFSNKINDDGFKIFCDEAKNNIFNFLHKLNLGKNQLGNESMRNFSTTFLSCINLTEVNFSYNNISDDSILYFCTLLNDLVDNIQIIDITNNKFSDAIKCFFTETRLPLNIRY